MTNYKLAISFYGCRKGTKLTKVADGYILKNKKENIEYFFSDRNMQIFLNDKIIVPIEEKTK